MKKYLKYVWLIIIAFLVLFLFKTRIESYFQSSENSKTIYDTAAKNINCWVPDFQMYDSTEIKQGMTIAADSMQINAGNTTIEKITKIGRYLVANFHPYLGNPKEFVFKQTPLQSYYSIKNKTTELYCTQYSLIFTFFCRINNIVTRRIESYGKNDRHTFNEVYLPETGEWVYVDLTYNILYAKKDIKYISLQDLYKALYDSIEIKRINVLSCLNNTDTVITAAYYQDTLRYNFDEKCTFLYHYETDEKQGMKLANRLVRYLKSEANYEYFSNVPVKNMYVYLKYAAFACIIILIFLLFKRNIR